ncbi:putative U2 small nuclear ribonucleoprotein 40K [Leishmania mexicana MHOM/GT/2001/U1103]|uniref:U2 small nuclear ribonucleoprotein 40K n=1 Tax=Leishmania mexicana (strain MHOM/GT/2001/U1103) TaxID=929439 RepID=E9B2D8_LEIMU|nr:putative U2 small nuclear ribonucleoprotein 40K [Leishmania mexicana MHOM/GT/2001/U1103]CBZ29401.1 putative U2 small nuclear ribonucleoprotein 40K [Leishmania mexicana MHOM/GT/2001/U1103]
MRLTMDLVRLAPQFTNTMLQREIDLRGLRISSLDEHVLVLLENNFDVVNLSSNALTALEYFPMKSAAGSSDKDVRMSRVTTLVAHRNEIQRVSVASCVSALPNVVHFLADRNRLACVRDLYFLKQWKKLEVVSLEDNPVWETNSNNFDSEKLRAFLVFLCPRLKLINYQRVTQADRERAQKAKDEFKKLVQSWETPLTLCAVTRSQSSSTVDGKKTRKRGREGRTAAATAVASNVVTLDDEPANGATSATPAAADVNEDDDAALQARLDQLEERLLSDDVTAEEIAQLEEEMTEISERMASARKRKRH